MLVYTYSEARQNLASVLNNAKKTGKVVIKRRDGSTFALTPESNDTSPFDVASIKSKATLDDILTSIKDSRSRME